MNVNFLKKIKIFFPTIFLLAFLFFIYFFYKNNSSSFLFVKDFKISIFFFLVLLCFCYLVTEALIFKKIAEYFNKDLNLLTSFFAMNTTYLFNMFIQFSGFGFRAYFLKKKYNISISNFFILSLFIILIEFYVFSLIGILFLIISYFFNYDFQISQIVKVVVYFVNILTLLTLIFHENIYNLVYKFSNLKKFFFFKNLFLFYSKDKKKINFFLIKFIPLFFFQFFIFFFIFFIIASSFFPFKNIIPFAIISTIATDFSFIFSITPQSVGVGEAFIYFGTQGMEISFAKILFLVNIFRLSIFVIYATIGPIYFYFFSKKLIQNEL